jgi:orotate phosphoribosyltransferase
MLQQEIIRQFEDAGAILRGHFILSSGLRSDTYLQCARLLMDPSRSQELCRRLAAKIIDKFGENASDLVISPAMGGVIVGYEMARQLGIKAIFCERVDGIFSIRRGFEIEDNARILVVEDVLTTGKSSLETFTCIEKNGGKVKAECCLVDRSNGTANLGIPLISLIELPIATYSESELPEHLKTIPPMKPGSRNI